MAEQMTLPAAMARFCAKLHDEILDRTGQSVDCAWQHLPMENAVLVQAGEDLYTIHLNTMEWIVTYTK